MPTPVPPETARPPAPRGDLALLGVAVLAVSTSGPLIRYAAAPALAIAMWRNALALPVLAIPAWRARRPDRREARLIALSGVFLAAHFATWVPSLSYTSVASSVALVATQPVWAALIARARGEHVHREVWIGIGVALVGVLVLSGVDLSISPRALFGDLLAMVGGALAAAYVSVGSEVRRSVGTAVYTTGCYGVASALLLLACLVSGRPIAGFSTATWLAIAALVVGPQLLGHTLVNTVLRSITATAVSVAILFEVVGATVIAALWFGETPPLAAIPAGLLIFSGIIVVIRAGRRRPVEGAPLG
ncbi:DMT family transporter [Acidimicrobiia bacterium EGI L10123]|uniref:DMT family transporter n=1 Tax=Salinilacustrithrix flava TaxID=2957203 RepID=UPI003D7C3643|nr:DMT family transporter [Acidimicrobiia bacterium EGI L10123]